ncbi:Uncharacterised protein [Mycobacterium tuberculosis]|nr:Uncharacterised protein [Mycobacterium tuberculosis]
MREKDWHTGGLLVVHLEGQCHPVWALQALHRTTSDPD